MTKEARRRYTVRKQSSGWTTSVTFFVYDLVRKGRVTVHAYGSREAAQSNADELEINEMVARAADDPRPYAVRLQEAKDRFAAGERAR